MDWARRSFHIERIMLAYAFAGMEMDIWFIRLAATELYDIMCAPTSVVEGWIH